MTADSGQENTYYSFTIEHGRETTVTCSELGFKVVLKQGYVVFEDGLNRISLGKRSLPGYYWVDTQNMHRNLKLPDGQTLNGYIIDVRHHIRAATMFADHAVMLHGNWGDTVILRAK